jgi:hypothetical protein
VPGHISEDGILQFSFLFLTILKAITPSSLYWGLLTLRLPIYIAERVDKLAE